MNIFDKQRTRESLLERLQGGFSPNWRGIHGIAHWSRVWTNGRRLAELEAEATRDVDRGVVELFAWLHDSCRLNDGHDPEHGPRAGVLARQLCGELFTLEEARLAELVCACEGHTRGGTVASPTVMVCWDADRLDLGRVGTRPDPKYLCTPGAKRKDVLRWAIERSKSGKREQT